MKKNRNYKEFDYQEIVVRKELAREIIHNYECFGWSVETQTQHSRYENLIEVEMRRSHFVKNKDDLQYLQVNMESDIVKRGRLNKRKHSKSVVFGISFSMLAVILWLCSILILLENFIFNSWWLAGLCTIVGIIIAIIVPINCVKIAKKENVLYAEKEQYYTQSIEQYIQIAKELLGAKDDKQQS